MGGFYLGLCFCILFLSFYLVVYVSVKMHLDWHICESISYDLFL